MEGIKPEKVFIKQNNMRYIDTTIGYFETFGENPISDL
jgi:hypothetical protein